MSKLTQYRGIPVRGNFTRFQVAMYDPCGKFIGVVAGMGRNSGTLDSEHGRSAAYAHAAKLRKCPRLLKNRPGYSFRVEPVT